jgi:GNAT superfamily N-acetyltransferase
MLKTEYVDNFLDFQEEAGSYFESHYETCEEYLADKEMLDIDAVLVQKFIDEGIINLFLLIKDEEVVGYINVSITPSILFKEPQAVVDFLYILPRDRKKGYASEAIKAVEKELSAEGIKRLTVMLPDKDYSEAVAGSLGYVKSSSIYNKYIGE